MREHNKSRLLTFDMMRGLAAIAVVFFHLGFIADFAPSGHLAVDFFFMLSGVVITKSYQNRLASDLTLNGFLLERIIRLYPLYFLGLLVGVLRRVGQIAADNPNHLSWLDLTISVAFNLAMLPSPVTGELAPINGPSWSIFLELFVNLAWAVMLVNRSTRVLICCTTGTGVMLCLALFSTGSADAGWNWNNVHIGVLRSSFGFLIGVILARKFYAARARDSALSLIAAAALCVIFVVDVSPKLRALYDAIAIFLIFPIIVCAGIFFSPPVGLRGMANMLGDISYPVYLLHLGPLFTASYFARKYGISPGLWIPAFIFFALTISLWLARNYDPLSRNFLRPFLEDSKQ